MSTEDPTVVATVIRVVLSGRYGPYAIALYENEAGPIIEGSITFSLQQQCWQESVRPNNGDKVVLTDLRKRFAGWRAYSGRFYRPTDELGAHKQGKTA